MEEFWILIFVSAFAINSFDKTESVKVKLELKTFDEIFGEGWWDNGKDEEWNKLTLEQNFHDEINRKNTQPGQIEPNSTDQLGQIEPNSTDQLGQIEPNSTDQLGQIEPNSADHNPSLTESDHIGQIPNSTDQNPPLTESDKRKIIDKFHAIKEEFKQKRKYSTRERTQIENKIAKHLKVSRAKIYKWKKEFGISQEMFNEKEERKHLIEKFDQMKAELKRDGLKTSYCHEIDETVAKELGISLRTIYNWKRKLGQSKPQHKHSHSEQKELMKLYYEIKDKNPKISDKEIVKLLNIGTSTLVNWKSQFIRQQFRSNSVDSVEENTGSNVPEIGNSNSEI